MILRSYAKLNLCLNVLEKRPDSYHNIQTVFERIDLHDTLTLSPRKDPVIRVACSNPQAPSDSSNLAYKAAYLLQQALRPGKGVDIRILKRIPVAAGLGGGSSNAAATLLGLNRLWRLGLSRKRLVDFAKKLGCDVPFFIYGASFASGVERGDKITPLGIKARLWQVLVVPDIKVSSALIYEKWDENYPSGTVKAALTRPSSDAKIIVSKSGKIGSLKTPEGLFNGLQEICCGIYPEVGSIQQRLKALGLESVLMSGSGPAVFGIVSSRKEAQDLCRQLRRDSQARDKSWQVFAVRTV